jgi:peptidase C25-like protein
LLRDLADGRRIVNYAGHGSLNLWRGDLLTSDDARRLQNTTLPMFVMMSCLNGYFQDAAMDSLGESLLKAEQGGAIAVWASSGMTTPQDQTRINQQLYRLMFGSEGQGLGIGELARQAKTSVADPDIRKTWVLLGDPTLRLK